MDERRYPSKIDAWLVLVLAGAIATPLALVFLQPTRVGLGVALAGATFVALPVAAFVLPCTYVLGRDALSVRAEWLLRRRIAYRDVVAIEPCRDPTAAPALSLRRVRITFGAASQLVSPRDREGFVAELRARVAAARGRADDADARAAATSALTTRGRARPRSDRPSGMDDSPRGPS